eukprot:COSAG01_NODE_1675_length_9535_cov_6.782959_3_plen_124_part_00
MGHHLPRRPPAAAHRRGAVSQNGELLGRRGRGLPANASGFDPRRASLTRRFDRSTAHNLAMRTQRSHAYAVSYRPLSALLVPPSAGVPWPEMMGAAVHDRVVCCHVCEEYTSLTSVRMRLEQI